MKRFGSSVRTNNGDENRTRLRGLKMIRVVRVRGTVELIEFGTLYENVDEITNNLLENAASLDFSLVYGPIHGVTRSYFHCRG